MDPFFAENLAERQESWRRVVSQVPTFSALSRRGLPSSLHDGVSAESVRPHKHRDLIWLQCSSETVHMNVHACIA